MEPTPDRAVSVRTLCFVRDGSRVLLGLKKRGFGSGFFHGFGGKVEPDETVEEAARRELLEESGLQAVEMEHGGVFTCDYGHDPLHEVHVFRVMHVLGEPVETDEMQPQWFDVSAMPYDRMWPDVAVWFPWLLRGDAFRGSFTFAGQSIVASSVEPAE